MEMKLFSLYRNAADTSVKMQIKVIGCLNGFADSDISFDEYTSLKDMFGGLSKALKSSNFIVIAVDSSIYNSTKLKLMTALSLKKEQNEAVLKKLSKLELDESAQEKNAAMPEGATVFVSVDGINSGFAVKKGSQTIVMIPFDDQRLDSVLKRGLVPYITNGGRLNSASEPEAAPTHEEKEEITSETTSEISEQEMDIAAHTLNILKESDIKVAVNGNTNATVMREFAVGLDDFDEYFTFTPHIEDRGDYNVTDYTAQMARSAKALSSATLGACISDIFTTNDGCDYICISVATDKSALVRKLYKEDGEDDAHLIRIACEEVFALIGEKAMGNNSVGIEIAQDEAPKADKKLSKKAKKAIISVIAIILVAAITVGSVYFVKQKNNNKEPQTEPPVQTQAPETTTEAPVKADTMSLSKLMRFELVNGIKNEEPETTPVETTAGAITANEPQTNEAPKDPNAVPSVITVNGQEIEAKEAIARIVTAETDSGFNAETLKAQAIITYTYLKYRDTNWRISNLTIADNYTQEVMDAVNEVFGHYLTFNDKVAFTPYCRMSAGKTANASTVFGNSFTYLKSVASASDKQRDGYKKEVLLTADDIKAGALAFDSTIEFPEDVSKWLTINAHDTAVSTGTGYVEKITVGNKEVSGVTFIYDIMKNKDLSSPCFSLSYDAESGTYTITTFGDGYGVGMSQLGADNMAVSGTKYDKILDQYFPGTFLN
ncbi:MAG: SpoIID/LytB domain-containing protein [Oscillospiraceae bacterium]|nr:SpoIID/LytB domain-containing protein [Oscillospiraceae bacterium]